MRRCRYGVWDKGKWMLCELPQKHEGYCKHTRESKPRGKKAVLPGVKP